MIPIISRQDALINVYGYAFDMSEAVHADPEVRKRAADKYNACELSMLEKSTIFEAVREILPPEQYAAILKEAQHLAAIEFDRRHSKEGESTCK